MPTKISLEGILEDSDGYIYSVPKEIWYCREDPLKVLELLVKTHRINEYKSFKNPFLSRVHYGIIISASNVSREKAPCLKDLIQQINRTRSYQPEQRTFRGGSYWGDYNYTPKPIRYHPRSTQTQEKLKKAFIKGLKDITKHYDIRDFFGSSQVNKAAIEVLEVLGFKNPREYLNSLKKTTVYF
ncbi:hypothetical protein HYV79_00150 [Candidatus Woesearchaeota archaeon]|nr:hypothetical protein [Candidatus Woesearchaeota archaeon]